MSFLVLGRSTGKSVIIGEGAESITVTVTLIEGNHVRLAFKTNTNIPIHREEIYKRIHGNVPTYDNN